MQAVTENAKQLDADDDSNNNHAELESTKAPEGLPPVVTVPVATNPAPGALEAPQRSARLPPRAVCLPPSPFSYLAAQPAAALQAGPKAQLPAALLPPSEAAAARAQPPGFEVAPAEPPRVEVVVAAAGAEPPGALAAAVTADHTGANSQTAVGGAAAEPSGTDIGAAAAAAAATMAFSAQADGACGGAEQYGIPAADEVIMHSEWHGAHVQWRVLAAIRMGAAMRELESL